MSHKSTLFYRGNTAVSIDFSAKEISSDGAVVLLEKIEREHKLLRYFSKYITDNRNPSMCYYSLKVYHYYSSKVYHLISLDLCSVA